MPYTWRGREREEAKDKKGRNVIADLDPIYEVIESTRTERMIIAMYSAHACSCSCLAAFPSQKYA